MSESIRERFNTYGGILLLGNRYGYRVNVSHPAVRPHYERFKKARGILHGPPTDEERAEFESVILERLEKRGKKEPTR